MCTAVMLMLFLLEVQTGDLLAVGAVQRAQVGLRGIRSEVVLRIGPAGDGDIDKAALHPGRAGGILTLRRLFRRQRQLLAGVQDRQHEAQLPGQRKP